VTRAARRLSIVAALVCLGAAIAPQQRALEAEPVVYREVIRHPRILLSRIHRITGRIGPGPSLGRPALSPGDSAAFTVPAISRAPQLEEAIAAAINSDRRARGLRTLRSSRQLSAAAAAHARSLGLAGAFTHDWPLVPRSPFGRWITRYYGAKQRRPWSAGENLLWAEDNLEPGEALTLWLNSPSHRKILTAPYWRELGVGVVRADDAGGVFGGRTVLIAAAEFGAR
jgi:uncharacterized protein YkwD